MDDSTTVDDVNKTVYRRRLDRTPDKHFEKLPFTDKRAVGALRKALEETKFRLIKLRDENDEKECIINEEKFLRKEAEKKLQRILVDLYNNPEVNQELHSRLPKAKKHPRELQGHPVFILSDEDFHDDSSDLKLTLDINAGDAQADTKLADGAIRVMSHDHINTQTPQKVTGNAQMFHLSTAMLPAASIAPLSQTQGATSSSSSFSSLDSSTYQALPAYRGVGASDNRNGSHSHVALRGRMAEPTIRPFTPKENVIMAKDLNMGPPDHISAASQLNHRIRSQGLPAANAELQVATNVYAEHPSAHGLMMSQPYYNDHKFTLINNPVAHGSLYNSHLTDYPQPVTLSHRGMHTFSSATNPIFQSSSQPYLSSHSNSYLPAAYPPDPAGGFPTSHHSSAFMPVNTSSMPPSLPTNSSVAVHLRSPPDESAQVSTMTRLLAELATLKRENNDLRDQLKNAKDENTITLKGGQADIAHPIETVGALIEDVRAAEKKHAEAAKLLVRAADDDKSAALKELEHFKSSNLGVRRTLSDTDLSEAGSLASERHESRRRLSKSSISSQVSLEHLVRRQREIMKEELQRVIDQRNEARQKVSELENKLTKLESKLCQLELRKSSDNKNENLAAKLRVTEEERDILLAKFQFLTQDIGETKLAYNLHKALLSDDMANDVNTYLPSNIYSVGNSLMENRVHTPVARESSKEKSQLEEQLTMIQKENVAQAECIHKMQQLIQRQRLKLNNLCAGPMLLK